MALLTKVLPNFFVVGAPKAGSTSLYHYLDQHPDVYLSPIKEPCYFASELRRENFSPDVEPWMSRNRHGIQEYLDGPMREKRFGALVSEWDDYVKLFQNVTDEKAIGEASVCYLWSRTAAANIFLKAPGAKIVTILRNPADRAFSQYLHAVTCGAVRRSFRDQILAASGSNSERFERMHPFLEFGLYYEQVKRYLDLFPKENVRIYLYEEYVEQPGRLLADIFGFLNVDASFIPDMSGKHLEPRIPRHIAITYFLKKYGIWRGGKRLSPRPLQPLLRAFAFSPRKSLMMERRDREYLVDYYREDIRKLARLLDRNLEGWLH